MSLRKTISLPIWLFLFLSAPLAAFSQTPVRTGSKSLRPEPGPSPAASLHPAVSRRDGDTWTPVDPATVFGAGDCVRVTFTAPAEGYVYVLNLSPSGKLKVLHPRAVTVGRPVRKGESVEMPEPGRGFVFDEEQGVELLQIYLSPAPLANFDRAASLFDGDLDAAESPTSGSKGIALSPRRSSASKVSAPVSLGVPGTTSQPGAATRTYLTEIQLRHR